MKIYSDYITKYSKKDTIVYISKFKEAIINAFRDKFNLVEVEPPVVSEANNLYSQKRIITFDNVYDEKIYQIPPFINFSLIKALDIIDAEPNSGVFCYSSVINRDIKQSPSDAISENVLFINVREYIADINYNNIHVKVKEIVDLLNSLPIRKSVGLKIPSVIKFTTVEKLYKSYPTMEEAKLLMQACLRNKLLFVDQSSGSNKYKRSLLDKKLGVYGNTTGTLYIYNAVSNTYLKLLTIYSIPTKDEVEKEIQDLELNNEIKQSILDSIPTINNQLGIEFHLSNYLVYTLQKYTINEIISCPTSLEMSDSQKKDIIM